MKASIADREKNVVTLQVEVETPRVEEALERAYQKLVRKANVPGFRKGKAPRRILENYLGKEPFYDEALDFILPQAYQEAVKEVNIEPIDRPRVELVQMEEGQPLVFKATVEVKPAVELGVYRGVPVEHSEVPPVRPEDVQRELENLQQRYARLVAVEDEPAREGDILVLDFTGYLEGETEPFPGGQGENQTLTLGSGTFIAGFEEQLVGAKAGEEREVRVTFPEDYREESLAGKTAAFRVQVKEVKRRELAPLDDEFAKDVSEFDTLEELRADLENKLRETARANNERDLRLKVVRAVAANATVEVPEVMVERRIDTFMEDLRQRLAMQGITMQQYKDVMGFAETDLREKFRPKALEGVKVDLVLEEVARREGLEAAPEEVEKEIREMAEVYGQQPEVLRQVIETQGDLANIKEGIIRQKTVDFLVENAQVTTVPAASQEQAGEAAGEE